MAGWVESAVYPFAQIFDTGMKPEGANAAARKVVSEGFPQLAAILESGAEAIGVAPSQISPFITYKRPATPTRRQAAYAAKLGRAHGVMLSGDTSELVLQSMRDSAKEMAKDLAIGVIADVLPVPPGVPAAQVVTTTISFIKNPEIFKTTEGRIQAGFAVASLVPVINIAVAPISLIKTLSDMHKAKSHMKAEIERAERFAKLVKSYIDAAVSEAQQLAGVLATRGVRMRATPDVAWKEKLRSHYFELEMTRIDDANDQLAIEKAQWYAEKGQAVSLTWDARKAFTKIPRELGRTARLRMFLQIARDLRKVRTAIEAKVSMKGTTVKSASIVAAEINTIAASILEKNPEMPVQQALNVASATSRAAAGPLGAVREQEVADIAVKKVDTLKKAQTVAGFAFMGLMAFLKLRGR